MLNSLNIYAVLDKTNSFKYVFSNLKMSWQKFWQSKGNNIEWSHKAAIQSKLLNSICRIIKNNSSYNIKNLKVIELGSGIGLNSLYFAVRGSNTTLLDLSPEAKIKAAHFWKGYPKFNFINGDLFTYNPKQKYNLVMSFGLAEHFSGSERQKVLKKHLDLTNDFVLISVPYKYGIFYQLNKFISQKLGLWNFGEEIPFTKAEFIQFAKVNKLKYKIYVLGFLASFYDFLIRKPLKLIKIPLKRRFDETECFLDKYLGCGIVILLKK